MKNKSKLETLKYGYVKIPNKVFRVKNKNTRLLLCTLVSYSESYNPTIRQLVRDTGMSNKTINKGLQELIDKCIIQKIGGFKMYQHGNVYEFCNIENWKI